MLLVDDHDDFRILMHHYLSSEGVGELDSAPDGETALLMVGMHRYDLILLDLQMPRMDGYQLARTLRRQGFTRPILAITAHAMSRHRAQALEAGCDALYTKPVTLPVLREAIRGYL
jgi:CheY-like chemotaxis protein